MQRILGLASKYSDDFVKKWVYKRWVDWQKSKGHKEFLQRQKFLE